MSDVKVTLMSWTEKPVETIYSLWEASKNESKLIPINEVNRDDAVELFDKIIAQRIPIGEHINFVFMLENVSVSFREQMVRHRIGTHVGENFGVDIVPDLAGSSWWSQSMRIQDMSHFCENGNFRIPQTVKDLGPEAVQGWKEDMGKIQGMYADWLDMGVPMEDARDLIPLGATHRISWSLNLAALQHVIGKRSCWILQAGLWFPVIKGMVEELRTKVDPLLGNLANPPCLNSCKDFGGCVFNLENERRVDGSDAHHACPLYLEENNLAQPTDIDFKDRAKDYSELWNFKFEGTDDA